MSGLVCDRAIVHPISVVVLVQLPGLDKVNGINEQIYACRKPSNATAAHNENGIASSVVRVVELLGPAPLVSREEEATG